MALKKMIWATTCLVALGIAAPAADAATRLVMKVSDAPATGGSTVIDPHLDWTGTGGVNEGVAGATTLTNNGVDYKDSWVDTNWGEVLSVRVSMYTSAVEVAFMEFAAAGTTKDDFFSLANLTSSSWTDTGVPNNFFSIAGDAGNDRHWFVNRNYGGCSVDSGWMVVLDGTSNPCRFGSSDWEPEGQNELGSLTRGFLYANGTTVANYNDGPWNNPTSFTTSAAEVFAVTVTTAPVPVPASGVLLAGALGGLAWRARKTKAKSK